MSQREALQREKTQLTSELLDLRKRATELRRELIKERQHCRARLMLKMNEHFHRVGTPSIALKYTMNEAIKRIPDWLRNPRIRQLMAEGGDWKQFETKMRQKRLW
jgi:hypothetical protein